MTMPMPATFTVRAALVLFALSGCSSSTVDTPAGNLAPAIPAGKAQVTINRTTGITAAMTKANVDVNGQRLGEFGKEEGYTTFVSPGRTTVAVSAATPPGRYAIGFNTTAGKVYRLQITSRPEGYAPEKTAGPFAYELVENDGAFKIAPVE
jgi:hypothetical protein